MLETILVETNHDKSILFSHFEKAANEFQEARHATLHALHQVVTKLPSSSSARKMRFEVQVHLLYILCCMIDRKHRKSKLRIPAISAMLAVSLPDSSPNFDSNMNPWTIWYANMYKNIYLYQYFQNGCLLEDRGAHYPLT